MAGDMMRLTDREQGRLAELCRKLAGPLGPVQVSHMAHLALGLGLDAMGKNVGLGADVGAPEPDGEAVRMGAELGEVAQEVAQLMGRVDVAVLAVDALPAVRAPRGLDADQSAEARERRRVRTNERNRKRRAAARKAKHVTSPVTPPVTECDGAPDEGSRG